MMDYDELIKALRGCTPEQYCEYKACKTFMEGRVGFCRDCLMKAAADAIEALQARVDRLTKENRELAADRPEMEEVNGHWEWKNPNDEQQMPKRGKWNNHEVACLLAEMFGDDCACNLNGIDEWLPQYCEFAETCCPNPVGVACWEQFLKHRAKMEVQDGANR